MSLEAYTDQKAAGKRVEADAVQVVDEIEPVDDSNAHADARATTAISPSADLPFVGLCVVERGAVIEIKSAMVRATASNSRGRFYIRQEQHEWLLEQRGVYLFAVCKPTPQRETIAMKIVPAAEVEDIRNGWKQPDDRAPYDQLAWSRVFDPAEINGGDPA